MNQLKRLLATATLALTAVFAMVIVRSATNSSDATAGYVASCAVVDATTVEGFVTNNGPALIQVIGLIRFSVIRENSSTYPMVQAQSAALIPAGQTMSVGRARMPAALAPGETCKLDVSEALR